MWNPYFSYLKAFFEFSVAKRLADYRLFLVPGGKPLAAHRQYKTYFKFLFELFCTVYSVHFFK